MKPWYYLAFFLRLGIGLCVFLYLLKKYPQDKGLTFLPALFYFSCTGILVCLVYGTVGWAYGDDFYESAAVPAKFAFRLSIGAIRAGFK
jgi:hypothetical protein